MGKYYWQNLRTINEWRLPPEDRTYPKCNCCGHEVYDDAYNIDGKFLCEDCAFGIYQVWLDDDAELRCEGCDELLDTDDPYFDVCGEAYCADCFRKYFQI